MKATLSVILFSFTCSCLTVWAGEQFEPIFDGQSLKGWHVSAIGRDAMRVSRGGKDKTLLLVTR